MAKIADEYFKVSPWEIIEDGFDPAYSKVAESVFSLANEHMGSRGCFEEGYTGDTLIGNYFNGIYVRILRDDFHYKGDTHIGEMMINSVNWLKTKIVLDGKRLDLAMSKVTDFKRVLDLKTGLLTREFVWETESGKQLALTFERLVSMDKTAYGAQRITMKPLNFSGSVEVSLLADNGIIHGTENENFWDVIDHKDEPDRFWVLSKINAGIQGDLFLSSDHKILCDGTYTQAVFEEDKCIGKTLTIELSEGIATQVGRIICNEKKQAESANAFEDVTFDGLLESNRAWWGRVWKIADITIDGDEKNQQGIRFCLFQMFSTYHGDDPANNIGAKGLTGEAYAGNTFWDTETYCLPFYMLNIPEAAKNLLMYRYHSLDVARDRAKELDCKGAFYPISSISGRESCNLWQHASLQLQATTGVAYGIWFYEKLSDDREFLRNYGAEMLVEIARMCASRGSWSGNGKHYGYYCVMGPDEFAMMVHNNCYTNFMGRFAMNYAGEVVESLKEDVDWYEDFCKRLGFEEEELADWKKKADNMRIPKEGLLYEQHDGFFNLPHVDVDAIPVEDFPLYHSWSYERLFRNDMIKQPDVLMMMLLFNGQFSQEELKANYEYYEPRTIHESSLSPSVHSILAAQLGKEKEAYDFFGFATRLDLDNYNRNTNEGLHTTSIAAAWMNIVYGFGGVRTDGERLAIRPSIPEGWKGYTFHLLYKGVRLYVEVTGEEVTVTVEEGKSIEIELNGTKMEASGVITDQLRGAA